MNFAGLLFLLITHFLTGRGILSLFDVKMKTVAMAAVSMLTGLMVASFLPFILQLCHVPITSSSVAIFICVVTVLACVPLAMKFEKPDLKNIKWPGIYEIPYFIIYLIIVLVSVWRCFYYPPTPRDMLTGPELIAKYTVLEKTMINSIYTLDLSTTNNYLKPAFVTSLQVIYKLFVTEVGQLWMSVQFISFLIWIYSLMKEKIHPVIGGLLVLFFLAIPEVFAYTFMLLFDYSSMVYFFAGFYFLARYLENKKPGDFALSIFMFAGATYVRSETLVLIGMALPLLAFNLYKDKVPPVKIIIRSVVFLLVPYVIYFLCIGLFDKYYIPVAYQYDVSHDVNQHLSDLNPLFQRFSDMNSIIIFSDLGKALYGYFFYIFILVLLIDVIFFRKNFTKEGKMALYGVVLLYLGLPFLGYLLPLMDLRNTTKRGLFKIFPLMLLYMRNSGTLTRLSDIIRNWEFSISTEKKPQTVQIKSTTVRKPLPPQPRKK